VQSEDELIAEALSAARDTKQLLLGQGVLAQTPAVFAATFPGRSAVIVADPRTDRAAGERVRAAFQASATALPDRFLFDAPQLYAEHRYVVRLQERLSASDLIPIAVGSGTINDVTKLAAHRVNRPYLCVATAASMDGYTAYGASITHNGSKQTFDCPAPRAVVADLDVIAQAPAEMNAWGYADLLAKFTAGADWILADELGVEPIDPLAWRMVQARLPDWTSEPQGVKRGDRAAIRSLMCGLLMSGFAMQATQSSRVASGAEHQFSHLWDMQQATDASHGAKVGVATVAVARLYDSILKHARWDAGAPAEPSSLTAGAFPTTIDELFATEPAIAAKAKLETTAKHWTADTFTRLRDRWPAIQQRVRSYLPTSGKIVSMLTSVGAPTRPDQIGISRQRLHDSFIRAYHIRRRFTVLDVAVRTGILESCLAEMEEQDVDA